MTLGIGIVGAGFMSRTYAYGIRELVSGARTVAVAGGTRAAGLAADFDADLEPSFEALIARDDVDIVLLGSPTPVHRDQALAAAGSRKHVFTEKPIAATLPEIDDMIGACRRAGVLLGVNAVSRWRRGIRMAKELVDAGEIGEIRMVRHTYAFPESAYAEPGHWILNPAAGSPFLDQGAHCNDAIRWFVGADAMTAYAVYGNYSKEPPPGQSAMVTYTFGQLRVAARARDRQDDRLPVRGQQRHDRRRVSWRTAGPPGDGLGDALRPPAGPPAGS